MQRYQNILENAPPSMWMNAASLKKKSQIRNCTALWDTMWLEIFFSSFLPQSRKKNGIKLWFELYSAYSLVLLYKHSMRKSASKTYTLYTCTAPKEHKREKTLCSKQTWHSHGMAWYLHCNGSDFIMVCLKFGRENTVFFLVNVSSVYKNFRQLHYNIINVVNSSLRWKQRWKW